MGTGSTVARYSEPNICSGHQEVCASPHPGTNYLFPILFFSDSWALLAATEIRTTQYQSSFIPESLFLVQSSTKPYFCCRASDVGLAATQQAAAYVRRRMTGFAGSRSRAQAAADYVPVPILGSGLQYWRHEMSSREHSPPRPHTIEHRAD